MVIFAGFLFGRSAGGQNAQNSEGTANAPSNLEMSEQVREDLETFAIERTLIPLRRSSAERWPFTNSPIRSTRKGPSYWSETKEQTSRELVAFF